MALLFRTIISILLISSWSWADTTNFASVSDTATLGSELTSANNWVSAGWTGSYEAGFTHIKGNINNLTEETPMIYRGCIYQCLFTVSNTTTGKVTFSFADYNSALLSNGTYLYTWLSWYPIIQPVTRFTPTSDFNGTISSISIKMLTSSKPTLVISNKLGFESLQIRSSSFYGIGNTAIGNTFIGFGAGQYNLASPSNIIGQNNTAVGYNAFAVNTTGTSNSAFGYQALNWSLLGNGNCAFGESALYHNTCGNNNDAIGAQALFNNTTGSGNCAIGQRSLENNITGNNNCAIGHSAGEYAGNSADNSTPNNSTFIGNNTKAKVNGGINEIVIGFDTTGHGSNTVTIGNKSITDIYFTGFVHSNGYINDSSLAAGECGMWFDKTNMAAKVMFKGKTADGTVVTGSIALTP